ncbi:MAG: hypothetical protein M3Q62_07705 [Actinomycetota bacterium]|nr:hypothetical protein [Rubrobacteraceae bacterium]MDQ3183413.1 hypothetical protein [Actinomycetota bacterium]MDQ3497211.1 hypothetical protein [Actinomycetota bacterium]
MTLPERVQTSHTPEATLRRPQGSVYWLIARNGNAGIEVLVLDRNSQKTLPVFSFEEEAEMFLRFGNVGGDWRIRESGVGELISVLYGLCAVVSDVALDPLPEMVAERFVGLVSLDRERFIERIMNRNRQLELRDSGQGSLREAEGSRRSGAYWLIV